jgi:ATP-dependent helicase Lhr and Lhr-like helicase
MAAFDRLSPALQYQIVNTLGFSSLRPVQELTIDAVLAGKNCVVLAPTAGGKTEAAFFPILSRIHAESWAPVSVLYLSPIKALLNNQQTRVTRYAGLLSRRVFTWHGDIGPTHRKRFINDPTDILLTTPESLEAMMMSARVPARALFEGLQAVIIDEVHAFANDDRGAHLSAVLERLTRFCKKDIQRIGLSATVGNPPEILAWMQGSSKREGAVISPPKPKVEPQISIDFVGNSANAALVIKRLHPGRKRLVFVDSRRGVEELGKLLIQSDVTTYVTHGSLSAAQRRDTERAFEEGSDCVIAATSALELGIDVGDLDHVLQLDSPPGVASFLQRMGRTGRRDGTVPNCTFLTTKDMLALQAAAIVRLSRQGYVESVRTRRAAFHIMAHQIMALGIQRSGIPRDEWWAWLDGASAFSGVTAGDREAIVAYMLEQTILADQGGKLWLGPKGEQLYGKRNFAELYAVFSVPRLITVRWNAQEIGTVDAQFLSGLDGQDGAGSFTLGGRPWQIQHVDWRKAVCIVEPAQHAKNTRWSGAPQYLGYEICQAMRQILVDDELDDVWSKRMQDVVTMMRAEHGFLRDAVSPMVVSAGEITWWTWAGGRANLVLAQMIEKDLGGKVVVRNESITCKDAAGESIAALQLWRSEASRAGRPAEPEVLALADGAVRYQVSKFQPCLPEELVSRLLVGSLDPEAVRRVLG